MKQFKQAIIHVGTDKTGSTSIQRAFGSMRAPLRRLKLAAYLPGDVHPMLGSNFCAEPESYVFNRNVGIVDRNKIQARDKRWMTEAEDFIKTAAGCPSLVASYEGFMHLPDEALQGLLKWVRRYADAVIAVMYVRNPHSYAVSAMGQNVRMGKEPCPNDRIPLHNFPDKIDRLIKVFGRDAVMVRSFEMDQLVGNDVVTDFLHLCGASDIIGTPDYVTPERENQRMSGTAMAFGGAFAKALLEAGLKIPATDYQRRFGSVIADLAGPSIKLSPEQAAYITENSRAGLDYLKKEFGIVFKDPPEKYIATEDDHRNDELIGSIAGVVANMVLKQTLLENAYGHIEVANTVGEAKVGSDFKLGVTLFNESSMLWQSSNLHPINIGYRFRGADGKLLPGGGRLPLPNGRLRPRDQSKVELKVKAPKAAGSYELEISVVQEQHAWLDLKGFTKYTAKLNVT